MTLYTHISSNIRRTWLLITAFLIIVILLGWFLSYVFNEQLILWIAVIFSIFMSFSSYWYSDKIVLGLAGAQLANRDYSRELLDVVDNLSITAGLPTPKTYIVSDPSPNAFATGRNPQHAAIAVTTGLLDRLNRTELEGVLSHELSHIGNRDILISSVVVVLAGLVAIASDFFLRSMFWRGRSDRDNRGGSAIIFVIGLVFMILAPIIAKLIQMAVSRKREFLADASGAMLTRYPEGLASALEKIANYSVPLRTANHATAHLYIEDPFKADKKNTQTSWFIKIFMTHPPVEERIKALRGMEI